MMISDNRTQSIINLGGRAAIKTKTLFLFLFFSAFTSVCYASPIFGNDADTSGIVRNINIAKSFCEKDTPAYDSALIYLNEALELAEDRKNLDFKYEIYGKIAELLYRTRNYSFSIDYYFKMLNILDEANEQDKNIDLLKKYTSLYRNIGVCMTVTDIQKALSYFNRSLQKAEEIYSKDKSYSLIHENRLLIYNNIGAAWIDAANLDSAYYYCNKALNYPVKIDNPAYYASLYNNLGIINWELDNFSTSMGFYRKSLEVRSKLNDLSGMSSVHYNLGLCYFLKSDKNKALEELNMALQMSREGQNIRIEMLSTESLAKIYEQEGDFYQSMKMLQLTNVLKDSIAGKEKINEIAKTELQYLLEKQLRENDLKQRILIAEKEQRTLVTVFIAIFLLFLLFVFFLLYRNQRIKNKKNLLEQESLSLQNENLELKNQQLKQSLEYKNNELDTHMMYLLKKNEFVTSIIEDVSELKGTDSGQLKSAIKEMKLNIEDSVWNEFNVLFQDMHKDFYTRLLNKHPNLSPNEKKLCALIHLNMSSKEISSITFQSVKSIEIARSRLRKKMNLSREENLSLYLQQF
ncbi:MULTISPECIES: tetratricopeptide repeat protein [unclassified Dysgonomonas]|uniref:tetratricopeptide repeat protein n=1 Tax=unclassified Dysgonomonas TaxID=2630389 RepID=UPI0024731EC1|nr:MULTISPECIES: tetratricopeptide repeat protein [unclassified Dysgonomonas]